MRTVRQREHAGGGRGRRRDWPTLFRAGQIGFSALFVATAIAADVDRTELPPAHSGQVNFQRDVQPILENNCVRCHGPERPKSGFRLDNRASALAGGDGGPAIFAGNSADSPLIHYVARVVREMEMPPTGKGEPLKPFEIALLRAWIDQGLDYGGANQPERARLSFDLTTGAGYIDVRGDRSKFRENSGLNDGWFGGVSEFSAQGPINEHTRFTMDGRVLLEQDEARLRFDVRRQDWGGFAGGVETRRKWSDDSGGYHQDFTPSQFATGAENHLDFGRAWFDLYLDRPDWPEMRLGYEFQFREGTEASTRWGVVTTPARNIYPSARAVDEQTHILKLDIARELGDWRLADSLRVEWHDQDNRRVLVAGFNATKPGPEKYTTVDESYSHTQGANALTVEKAVREWLAFNAGYLYSWLDGGATFDQAGFLTDTAALAPTVGFTAFGVFADRFYTANRILLDRQANVGSVGLRLGPWDELVFYGGAQADWSRQRGLADVTQRIGSPTNATSSAVLSWSDIERQLLEERAGVRFTGLPSTSLYAEGLWQQEEVVQFEDQSLTLTRPNLPDLQATTINRGTDAEARVAQYRVGLSSSPWRSFLVAAHYGIARRETDYAPTLDDASAGPQGGGYPNFMTGRRIDSEEIEASLTTRLGPRLRSRFTYQFNDAEYETRHWALFNGTPAGAVDAGNQEADLFSVGVTWNPLARLSFDVSGSMADTRLHTFANHNAAVVPYDGAVWSVAVSANWRIDERTDLLTGYGWSSADYQQENFTAGLPLGLEYQWHQLRASLNRRLNEQLSTTLLYYFQRYDEPTAGGFNDYTAHGIFASLTWHWRE